MVHPSPQEVQRRNQVVGTVVDFIRANQTIKLPEFNPETARPNDRFALINIGLEPNDFSGTLGDFRYQFEGEEDLLHLIVTKAEGLPVSAEEGQWVTGFVLQGVPPALIWLRPGQFSQHFYVGHDDLLGSLKLDAG